MYTKSIKNLIIMFVLIIFLSNCIQEPQPVKPWIGVWNATIPGSDCIGFDHRSFKVVGQEDCLYLNVYTPKVSI